MKTIKQIADEIGVQKQTIGKRIKREPLCTLLSSHIHTKEGTQYIDVHGEKHIKTAYNITMPVPTYTMGNTHNEITHQDTHSDMLKTQQEHHNAYVQMLRTSHEEHVKTLQDQLVSERARNDELTKTITTMTDTVNKALLLTNNAQHLHAAETMKLEPPENEPKQGFLKRIFGRKSSNPF